MAPPGGKAAVKEVGKDCIALVQARMNSSRFPGKVLAPLRGVPLVRHVIERVAEAVPRGRIVLATSTQASDDPLAAYAPSLGVRVVRGDLDNVVARFQQALQAHPCEWFFRVCADSPLLDAALLLEAYGRRGPSVDVVTNVFPRTFAKGHSVELLRTAPFLAIDAKRLPAEEAEHATQHVYRNPAKFRLLNIPNPGPPATSRVVDTLEDLRRLEAEWPV